MLTQAKVNYLIDLEKKRADNEILHFPLINDYIEIPVVSINELEFFLIDVNRKGTIKLSKCTYQKRYRKVNILIRLDIDGPPHSNPEAENAPLSVLEDYLNERIECPHLHLYVENYGTKWAIPAGDIGFSNEGDLYEVMKVFLGYCNVVEPYNIQKRLIE